MFKVKRRLSGAAGAPASLGSGQLAWNSVDKTLYIGDGDNGSGMASSIVALINTQTTGSFATQAYVDGKISTLVNGAGAALDTLKELADALGGDANFSATVSAQISGKLSTSAVSTFMMTVLASADAGTVRSAIGAAATTHNHNIGDITNLTTTLGSKLDTSAYTAADVLTKIKTVDGEGSGLDADMLRGVSPEPFGLSTLSWLDSAEARSALGIEETGGSGIIDTQQFDVSGTWHKPATGTWARIRLWGGGGGASRINSAYGNGGGGGGYLERWVELDALGATETVIVGAGGAGRTGTAGAGTAGGNTTFGSVGTAYGGAGGALQQGVALGGSAIGPGVNIGLGTPITFGVQPNENMPFLYWNNSSAVADFGSIDAKSINCGGCGACSSGTGVGLANYAGRASHGGGGGASGGGNPTGGTSQFGGAGGSSAVGTGGAGQAPGGGGGASSTIGTGNGGSGAPGRCIVEVF